MIFILKYVPTTFYVGLLKSMSAWAVMLVEVMLSTSGSPYVLQKSKNRTYIRNCCCILCLYIALICLVSLEFIN